MGTLVSTPQMRKFLKGFNPEEWRQVLQCSHSFAGSVREGTNEGPVDWATVRKWVLVPNRSNKMLGFAVSMTAAELLPGGWAVERGLPVEFEDVRAWVESVA